MVQEQSAVQGNQETSSRQAESIPGPSQETANSSAEEKNLHERVERARKFIEQKRQEKEEKEKEEAKQKEFDRRHVGQEMAKAKRDRQERQAQDIANQIKEDRAKERAHREAVRQQIARDRAEREARRQNELQERQRAQAAAVPSAAGAGTGKQDGRDCTSARLQFRLPDGSTITNSFPADSPLETIRQYIVNQLGCSSSSITLYTTYPRRELTEEDLVKSLADLGLAPSSILVVALKSRNAMAPSGGASFSELLVWILSPLFALINFLKAFLFGSPDQPRGAYSRTPGREDNTPQPQQSNSSVRRRVPGGGTNVREEGGVYRLHNRDDEDDDNNTWNGNSTQQM